MDEDTRIKRLDIATKVLGFIIAVIAIILTVLIIIIFSTTYSVAQETSILEPIPFEEQIKHDEQVAYEEYCKTAFVVEVSAADIDLMARVVMSEASVLSYRGKVMVASTIVNRLLSGRWGSSISEVVNYPNAYSQQDNGEPTDDCYLAAYESIMSQRYAYDMYYFRTGEYHSFGYPFDYEGNTYFSTEHEWRG